MPHPVGGAMGVTLCHCREKGQDLSGPVPRLFVLEPEPGHLATPLPVYRLQCTNYGE